MRKRRDAEQKNQYIRRKLIDQRRKKMKKKMQFAKKAVSLLLCTAMIMPALPAAVHAAPGENEWRVQRFGDNVDQEIPEGTLGAPEDGSAGFTFDYREFYDQAGYGSVILYNAAEESYEDSVWTFDLTVSGEGAGAYRVGMFPRFIDGKNCDGIAIDTSASIQHSSQVNGSEAWPGITNQTGISFQSDTTYSMRFVTCDDTITMYVNDEKVAETDTRSEITEGRPAVRVWGPSDGIGHKTVEVSNYSFRELKKSSVDLDRVTVLEKDWGMNSVEIPVTLADGDAVESVKNSGELLAAGTDYTLEDGKIILSKEYIAAQEGSFTLDIAFEGLMTDTFSVVKYVEVEEEEYIWTPDMGLDVWQKLSGSGTAEMEEGGLRLTGENKLFALDAPSMMNGEIEITFDQKSDYGRTGFLFRGDPEQNSWQGMLQEDDSGAMTWAFRNSSGTKYTVGGDGTFLLSRAGLADTKLKVRFQGETISVWLDDYYVYSGTVSDADEIEGMAGISTESQSDILVKQVVFRTLPMRIAEEDSSTETSIAKNDLTVALADDFPRVIDYTLNGKKLYGSEFKYNYVTINTVDYPASAEITSQTDESVVYSVNVEKAGVTFDVEYTVLEGNILDMRIKNINDEAMRVNSIGFPNQPMLSATSRQPGAKLDTIVPSRGQYNIDDVNEVHYNIADGNISFDADTACIIPVITTDELSASMENNVLMNMREFRHRAYRKSDGTIVAGFSSQDFMYRGIDGEKMFDDEDLYCQVVLTEDTNEDGTMDWQDGANALKTIIKDKINGGDTMADSFIHVGYNFASGAQQPFLKVADNMKRLSNMIDGFDQILIFKGYANEGHDSGHSDYDDINHRAGDAEDMQKAAEIMQGINSIMGIHINHSESYPEAKMYNDQTMSVYNGWAWMDQSKRLRRDVDILNGGMDARLNSMFEQVPGIGFVYVDTYGDDRWAEARLAQNLVGDHGAMLGTENKSDFDRFAAWVHWPGIGDGMHRFVYHTQKDVYNSSSIYRGGYSRSVSMMSWQHNNNINSLVQQFYTEQLPQRYLMNHDVRKQTSEEAIFEGNVRSTSEGKIYKDGSLIADGSLVFIPWFAEDSETKDPDEAAKIYHWNPNGGETTWTLPESWSDLSTVKLYETTQNGKNLVDTLEVTDGQVTISAEAATPYVVYPGEAEKDETVWSEGSPLKDTGFNSRDFSVWEKDGDADIEFNDDSNGVSILTMSGTEAGQVSQTMEGLKGGQKYRLVVHAGAENGKTARLKVETPDGKTYENYVDQVVMANQYFDSYAKGKMVQRMWVDFVQPEGETTAKVTLSADACESADGVATFMETRIVKTEEPDLPSNYVANETFEYVEQGAYGIFNPERSADGVPHLSETHLPYTSDTISGNWSLKLYGLYGQGDVTVRTSPATMRLEPNTTYRVEFDTLGDGRVYVQSEAEGSDQVLNESFAAGHSQFEFTTGNREDYIVRIERGSVLDNFEVYSLNDPTAPSVPEGLTVTAQDGGMNLTWNESTDEDTWVTGYNVYRDGVLIASVTDTQYRDTDMSEYTTYSYQVSAVNVGKTESDKCEPVSGYNGTDLKAPEVISAELEGTTDITVVFNEAVDKKSAETLTNYMLSDGGSVSGAALQEDGKTVKLTADGLPVDKPFLLTVAGVQDTSSAMNACTGEKTIQLSIVSRYFKFDEDSTETAYDFSAQENGVKTNVGVAETGLAGNAGDFNKNGNVQISGEALTDAPEWTFSAWINWDGSPTESQTIMGNDVSGSAVAGMWFHIRTDNKLWASPYDGSRGVDLTSSQTVPVGEWTHVAITFKDKEFVMYFNGEETARAKFESYPDSVTNPINIGSHYNSGGSMLHKYGGLIDEVKIYRMALDADQILAQAQKTELLPQAVGDTFIVNKTNPADLSIITAPNGYTLKGITVDGAKTAGENYSFDGSTLTVAGAYLSTLETGEHTLGLVFDSSDGADTQTIDLTLKVIEKMSSADKSSLYLLLAEAAGLNESDYSEASWAALQDAVETAQEVFENTDASQEDVDSAAAALRAAIDALVPPEPVSTTVLEYALSLAETADTEGVVDSVVKIFNDAKAAAEDILARVQEGDPSVTQEMVDESWQNLIKAMQYLSFKQGDKTDLQKVIDMAKSLDLNEYLDEGRQAFTDALAAAEAVLANGDAMQDEVDQSWRDLLKAMSELRLKPNKDALKDLIDEANAMSTEGADDETIAAFQNALAAAMSVYDNEQATEEEVATAEEGLQAALDQLRAAVGDAEDPDNSGSDGNTGNGGSSADTSGKDNAPAQTDTTKNNSAQKSVKTGDTAAPIAGMAAVMMLAAAAGVIAYRRRRETR